MKSRKGGDMHLRDDWQPIQKSEMIESFIVTPEKRDAMGLPDSVPSGWWVGYQVRDPEVWSKIKTGERTGFSIHGKGRRVPVESR
jgi:Putative phage serine protease XkdF